jgi:hypothetical protein
MEKLFSPMVGLHKKMCERKLPSSAEEGWLRESRKWHAATIERADGVVLVKKFDSVFEPTTRPRQIQGAFGPSFFMARPPLLSQGGEFWSPQFNARHPSTGSGRRRVVKR